MHDRARMVRNRDTGAFFQEKAWLRASIPTVVNCQTQVIVTATTNVFLATDSLLVLGHAELSLYSI
jgi:hypothetical protein